MDWEAPELFSEFKKETVIIVNRKPFLHYVQFVKRDKVDVCLHIVRTNTMQQWRRLKYSLYLYKKYIFVMLSETHSASDNNGL